MLNWLLSAFSTWLRSFETDPVLEPCLKVLLYHAFHRNLFVCKWCLAQVLKSSQAGYTQQTRSYFNVSASVCRS